MAWSSKKVCSVYSLIVTIKNRCELDRLPDCLFWHGQFWQCALALVMPSRNNRAMSRCNWWASSSSPPSSGSWSSSSCSWWSSWRKCSIFGHRQQLDNFKLHNQAILASSAGCYSPKYIRGKIILRKTDNVQMLGDKKLKTKKCQTWHNNTSYQILYVITHKDHLEVWHYL